MINLDLIKFSDYIEPADIVGEIIRQNPNIKTPIPLEDIAQAAGISDIQYTPFDGLEGALVANEYKSEGKIFINSNQTESTRKRFTLGHELGHFMIPTHGHIMQCSIANINFSKGSDKVEIQASSFSSEIIMPESIFCKHDAFCGTPSISKVLKLSQDFNVSFEACIKKYVNKHKEPLIVTFFKNKKFRYYDKKPSIPFWFSWGAKRGVPAPFGSLSSKVPIDIEEKIYQEYVPSCVWLKKNHPHILPNKIIEEVYVQTNGFSVSLLKFDKKENNEV